MRIERREVESANELTTLVTEVLEGEIKGFRLIDSVELPGDNVEIGLLVGDAQGRLMIVAAGGHSGDSLILSYGKHVSWLRSRRDALAKEHPRFDWTGEPGIVLMAEDFSPHVLLLTTMLGVAPKRCYSIKCLGIGEQKGLYVERVTLPEIKQPAGLPVEHTELLTKAVSDVVGIAEDLSVSASFGYVSESLDWVPVANIRKRSGTVWVESGPGKWTTKKVDDEGSLGEAIDKVKASYDEVLKTKGEARNLSESELSEAERKSLKWE
jgi:hypothetical protein